jgi:hypothetical protein
VPNPSGKSNLNFPVPYGGVKARTQLLKAAPVSGAPQAGSALNTPQRAQRQASQTRRPQQAGQTQTPAAAPTPPLPGPSVTLPYPQQIATVWTAFGAIPGASELVLSYAAQADRDANRGD